MRAWKAGVMDLRMEPSFNSLYDEAKSAIVAGYEDADSRVTSFAIEHDLTCQEVWDLVSSEASSRGDAAIEYLADHPPVAQQPDWTGPAIVVLGHAASWAWDKWSQRRQ